MEKNIIIIGPPNSGKTLKAREIAKEYRVEDVIWIDGRIKFNSWSFSACDIDTRLIVIDDIALVNMLDVILLMQNRILVYKKGIIPFGIKCPIIAVFDSSISKEQLPQSFISEFQVIELNIEYPTFKLTGSESFRDLTKILPITIEFLQKFGLDYKMSKTNIMKICFLGAILVECMAIIEFKTKDFYKIFLSFEKTCQVKFTDDEFNELLFSICRDLGYKPLRLKEVIDTFKVLRVSH